MPYVVLLLFFLFVGCKKEESTAPVKTTPKSSVTRLTYAQYTKMDWYRAYALNLIDTAQLRLEERLAQYPTEIPTLPAYAEILFRKREYDRAELFADSVLRLDSTNGHAYRIKGEVAYARRRKDTTLSRESYGDIYRKAASLDSTSGKNWKSLLTYALEIGDEKLTLRCLTNLAKVGFYTPNAVEASRLRLEELPKDAIFLSSGDLEYFPLLMMQKVENVRPDVLVLNASLLNTMYHIRHAQKSGLLTDVTDEKLKEFIYFKVGLEMKGRGFALINRLLVDFDKGKLTRPLCFSSLPTSHFLRPTSTRLRYRGLTREILAEGSERHIDADTLAVFFRSLDVKAFQFPMVSAQETSPVMLMERYMRNQDFNLIVPALIAIDAYLQEGKVAEAKALTIDAIAFLKAINTVNKRSISILQTYEKRVLAAEKK